MTRIAALHSKQRMEPRRPTTSDGVDPNRVIDRILARKYLQGIMRTLRKQEGPSGERVYQPRMDLFDDPNSPRIVATLELPGLKQSDMSVRVEENHLVVQGERRFRSLAPLPVHTSSEPSTSPAASEPPNLPRGYTMQQIKYGLFRKVIGLPAGIQTGHIKASLAEGMLTISWPRNPSAEPLSDDVPDTDVSHDVSAESDQ